MQKRNAVFGLVIFNKEVGGVELEVLEEDIGWFLGPVHEVKVIVDVWSVSVNKALGDQLVHGLWWGGHLVLTTRHCFGFRSGLPPGGTQVVSLAAFAGFDVGGPVMGKDHLLAGWTAAKEMVVEGR